MEAQLLGFGILASSVWCRHVCLRAFRWRSATEIKPRRCGFQFKLCGHGHRRTSGSGNRQRIDVLFLTLEALGPAAEVQS